MDALGTLGPDIVGIDGSDESLHAVRWAAVDAHGMRRPLRIVHSSIWPLINHPMPPGLPHDYQAGMHDQEQQWLRQAAAAAEQAAPGVQTEQRLVTGSATVTLIAESARCRQLVVGSRGLGGFIGMLVGSTSTAIAAHASCPVVIVRDAGDPDGPVLVGLDGSPASDHALGYAFDAASRAGAPLRALHAWNDITLAEMWAIPAPGASWESFTDAKTRMLAEQLAGWQEKYPDVTVDREVVQDRPSHHLVEAGRTARLLVVGSRGRGGFTGMLLGSVSRTLVHPRTLPTRRRTRLTGTRTRGHANGSPT